MDLILLEFLVPFIAVPYLLYTFISYCLGTRKEVQEQIKRDNNGNDEIVWRRTR